MGVYPGSLAGDATGGLVDVEDGGVAEIFGGN